MKRQLLIVHILILWISGCISVVNAADAAEDSIYNKYPNSLLLRTRTAATYPSGLHVFTWVGQYQDYTERRNPITGKMEDIPSDMERKLFTSTFWWEYGVTNRFQVGVNTPLISRTFEQKSTGLDDSETGMGDISLYSKYKILSETEWLPAVTVDGFLKLPTGDTSKGMSNDETDGTLGTSLSKRWDAVSFHVNPEYTFTGGHYSDIGAAADDRFRLNCGVLWHATDYLLPSLEWNGMWWGDVGDQQEVGGGILWFPAKNVSVKLAVAFPIDSDVPWESDRSYWIKVATWF